MKEYHFNIKNKRWTIKTAQEGDEHLMMLGAPCIAQLYKHEFNAVYGMDLQTLGDEISEFFYEEK